MSEKDNKLTLYQLWLLGPMVEIISRSKWLERKCWLCMGEGLNTHSFVISIIVPKFRCDSITPFGEPVVPEEYGRTTILSASTEYIHIIAQLSYVLDNNRYFWRCHIQVWMRSLHSIRLCDQADGKNEWNYGDRLLSGRIIWYSNRKSLMDTHLYSITILHSMHNLLNMCIVSQNDGTARIEELTLQFICIDLFTVKKWK